MTRQESFLFSSRFVVTVMCFWSLTNMMCLRTTMSVAIVCMVNQSQVHSVSRSNNTSISPAGYENTTAARSTDQHLLGGNETVSTKDITVQWDTLTQGQVLGSYYYGYAASKIPTGWVLHRVGGRNLIFASSLVATTACLLTPIVALQSAAAVVFLRVLLGVCGGILLPSVQSVLRNWSPLSERSRMGGYTFAGFPCGTLVAFIVSGLLCEHGFAGGWPSVFYTFGIFSLIFSLLWLVAVSETPQTHLCIRRSEKDYIQAHLGESASEHKIHTVPWRSILTSPPVYAVIACGISTDFVGNMLLMYLPTYLADVMNFNIASSGWLSALPYVFCFVTLTLGGNLSDYLIKHSRVKRGTVRKLISGSGMTMSIVSLICISFLDSDQAKVAVALLVFSLGGTGLMTIGYFVNPLDIAPEHAGIIAAIASTCGDISGFISSAIVAAITAQGSLQQSWQIVFLLSAAVVIVCLIIYLVFASGDIQPWAYTSQELRISSLKNSDSSVGPWSKDLSAGDAKDRGSPQQLIPGSHPCDKAVNKM